MITFFDNHGKEEIYSSSVIRELYFYLGIIGSPNTLGYSIYHYQYFGINNNTDTGPLLRDIADMRDSQGIICDCCGSPVHKSDSWIIRGPSFLHTSTIMKNNQWNALHGDKPK